ncbi:hypothetical protein [Spirochaeta africana]|uniref:Outer membrane protein beta-barrel domain-containing protein n=1 Tax=Spirochaeta africana (strain ATCC 700263 / DSM 8902 / Z-7692) TaxID=889378 RepID=H9UID7_SPIAZ|nr:hypothetical protein [Spirochaeta africana]AFG37280.1 hypothetical protein Spiaf_1201 [Spirochaeta africana DSM 8902]
MKKLVFLLVVLALVFAPAVFAQENENAVDDEPVQVQQTEREPVEQVVTGNYLTFQAGMVYNLLDSPYTRFSLGYDFSVNPNFVVSGVLGTMNKQNKGQDFDGVTSEGGESKFAFAGVQFKFMLGNFYLSNGYNYQTLTSGYITEGDEIAYLNRAEVSDALGVNLGIGYYSLVGQNLLLTPEFSVNYNLPTSEDFDFNVSDIGIGIGIGFGLDMRSN